MVTSLFFGLTASIFFANSTTFGLESIWLNCSSSVMSFDDSNFLSGYLRNLIYLYKVLAVDPKD